GVGGGGGGGGWRGGGGGGGGRAVVRDLDFAIDLPDVQERRARPLRLAVDGHGPDQLFLAIPIARHVDAEDVVVLAGIEVFRLTAIRGSRLEAVLRADRNDRLFDVVPVQITEHHVEAAVGDAFPSLVDGNDALAGVEADVQLGRLRLRGERQRHQGRCAQRADKRREPPIHCCWLLVVVLALLRASSAALYSSSLKSYQLIHAKPISSIV